MQILVSKLEQQYANETWEGHCKKTPKGAKTMMAIVVLMLAGGVLPVWAKSISSLEVYSLIDTKSKSLEWELATTLRAVGALP